MESGEIANQSDVFVVSDNIISSLGFTTEENIASILNGKTGIAPISDNSIYPEPFMASAIHKQRLNELLLANQSDHYTLLEGAMILSISEALSHTSIDLSANRSLLIFSTTKGDISYLSGDFPPSQKTFLWETAQTVSRHFGIKSQPLVVSNACVSGVYAVELGARLLRRKLYEYVIVVGADTISAFTVSGFQSFKSISPQICKPYDRDRDGLSIGEGIATLILTNKTEHKNATLPIYIRGGATANDANHISGPSRTGDGLHYAIENAIRYAGINKQEVDFMNLHGTATIFNDEMESKAIALSGLSQVPANSLKGYWGHTLGASGVMEIVACIESLRKNQLFATRGFSELGVPIPMNIITKNQKQELHTCLKTASGFGGFNSAIILSKEAGKAKTTNKTIGNLIESKLHCTIKNQTITVNDQVVFENKEAINFKEFIKSAFINLHHTYPKFYKMDSLSKLGFIAVRYLLQEVHLSEKYDMKKVALLFSNSASSLDTDIRHQQSIQDAKNYFPSPAIFVYTLPNIVLGEICIYEKIQGETAFFVSEQENETIKDTYLRILLEDTDMEAAIVGTLDCLGEEYQAEVELFG